MIKNIPTITIALSAYNEQNNIQRVLESIAMQKQEGFKIKALWVYSDGSTDKTVSRARAVKFKNLKVIDSKRRIGKSLRLNQIYKKLDTDFLIQTDADVIFAHPFVIRNIIRVLKKDDSVGMCGGNPIPLHGVTFVEKAINLTCEVYLFFRSSVSSGNNVFSADGRLLAYRKEFIKQVYIPADMIANDAFTYYFCKKLGYEYRYVASAKVFYRSPQTLKDHIKQNTRFLAAPMRMKKYFPASLIDKETYIPRNIYVSGITKVFFKSPLLSIYIFLINKYCLFKAKDSESGMNSKWDMALTTKKVLH